MKPFHYRNNVNPHHPHPRKHPSSSWDKVGSWYSGLVGQKGQYFHEHSIIPGVIRLAKFKPNDHLLDLGCGEGILARRIPRDIQYTGVDIAPSLIADAQKKDHGHNHQYLVADCTKTLQFSSNNFTHATFILSLQNMEYPERAIAHAARALISKGQLIIVLNHPCFRIPRQSGWGINEHNKLQYRWVNRYLSPIDIPITMHPGKQRGPVTWSFHFPLSFFTKAIHDAGMVTTNLEEWASDKTSEGPASRMENRARSEIPLFLAIHAVKR